MFRHKGCRTVFLFAKLRIFVNIAAPRDQFFPAIGIDSDGMWFAMWQDTRLDPANHLISTFQGESTDGGQTWTNHVISTASFDARKSFFTCGCFIGDYNQIAVSDEVVLPAWTDGRPKITIGLSGATLSR